MGDAIGEILDVVSTVAAIVPGPWQVPAMAYRGMKAVSEGNLIGAAMSAYGLNGAGGFSDFGGGEFGGDFGGDFGGGWDNTQIGEAGFGGFDAGGDFGYWDGTQIGDAGFGGGLEGIFSPDYAQGAQEFAANWGDTPLVGSEGAMGVNNMSQGLGQLPTGGVAPDLGLGTDSLGGTPTSALGTPSGIPSEMNPDMTGQASGNYTGGTPTQPTQTTLEGMGSTNMGDTLDDRFSGSDPFATTKDVNKGFSNLTGYGSGNDYGKNSFGLPQGGLQGMWDQANTPLGSKPNGQTPLGIAGRGLGALFDIGTNRSAMNMYKDQMNQNKNWVDPNRARGDFANQEWMKTQSDPMYGYGSFMQGAGRDFTNQARAQAAKSGNRGGYLNSGRMGSDLASLWQKNQTQRAASQAGGFSGGNNPALAQSTLVPGYAQMMRNQYAPIGQAISNVDRAKTLADLGG